MHRQGGQLGEVPHGNPPLPAGALRPLDDLADVQVLGLVEEVHVKVGVHVEGFGQPEDDRDVLGRVGVVVGAAADEVAAHLQSLAQEPLGAGRLEDAFLGEGAELQLEGRPVLGPQRQHRLHAHESDDGIDLDVGPHGGRPGCHRQIEHAARALADVVHREAPLGLADQPDGLEGRGCRLGDALGQQGLVEVDVGFHQPGRDDPSPGVDRLAGGAGPAGLDGRDATVGQDEVDEIGMSG